MSTSLLLIHLGGDANLGLELETQLGIEDITIRQSRSVEDALVEDAGGPADVVVLICPGSGDIDRVREERPEVPLVVVGEAADTDSALAALDRGAEEYLALAELDALPRAVHMAVRRRQRRDRQIQNAAPGMPGRDLLLRVIARNFPHGAVFLFDHDLRFTYAEGQALTEAGLVPKSLAGKTLHEVLPPDAANALEPYYRTALQGESVTFQRANYVARAVPVRDDRGTITGGLITSVSTGELRQAEEALRQSEARTRAIVNSVVDGIITVDEDGIIESFNPAAERIFGYGAADVIGRHMKILFPPTDLAGQTAEFSRAVAFPEEDIDERIREENGLRADGTSFPIDLGVNKVDVGGRKLRVVSVRDITERKEIERLREELVAMVSHELRTPLTSIHSFSELMLEREFSPEKQQRFVSIIYNATLRLSNLINSLLDIQRMNLGRDIIQPDAVDLGAILQEEFFLYSKDYHKAGMGLEVPETLPLVWADEERIHQVVGNLLSNAIKFSPDGGEITLGAAVAENHVRVWVEDHGLGIPAAGMPKLFRRFYRVDSPEHNRIKGTGLGLAMVKEIIDQHEGEVTVDTETGRGSTFAFTLPLAPTRQRKPE